MYACIWDHSVWANCKCICIHTYIHAYIIASVYIYIYGEPHSHRKTCRIYVYM